MPAAGEVLDQPRLDSRSGVANRGGKGSPTVPVGETRDQPLDALVPPERVWGERRWSARPTQRQKHEKPAGWSGVFIRAPEADVVPYWTTSSCAGGVEGRFGGETLRLPSIRVTIGRASRPTNGHPRRGVEAAASTRPAAGEVLDQPRPGRRAPRRDATIL